MLINERPVRLKEAAKLIGLSPKTLYAMMYTGELQGIAHRFGPRLLYFYESELMNYMQNRKYIPLKEAVERHKAAKVPEQ